VGVIEPGHLLLILLVALFVLGPGKIGDLGGQLGRGIRDFRDASEGKTTPALPAGSFCTKCGAALGNDAKFCSSCGAPRGAAAA